MPHVKGEHTGRKFFIAGGGGAVVDGQKASRSSGCGPRLLLVALSGLFERARRMSAMGGKADIARQRVQSIPRL
jgi:hypothetical protein